MCLVSGWVGQWVGEWVAHSRSSAEKGCQGCRWAGAAAGSSPNCSAALMMGRTYNARTRTHTHLLRYIDKHMSKTCRAHTRENRTQNHRSHNLFPSLSSLTSWKATARESPLSEMSDEKGGKMRT